MANESTTLYKLIILYILKKSKTSLPPGIISDFITEKGYTNYFSLQNAFGELLESELIAEDTTYKTTYYTTTDDGEKTLELFGQKLSGEIKNEIDVYLENRKIEIINETSLISDYTSTNHGTCLATCTLKDENQVIFQLQLDVANETEAIRVCEHWKEQSAQLYQMVLTKLL